MLLIACVIKVFEKLSIYTKDRSDIYLYNYCTNCTNITFDKKNTLCINDRDSDICDRRNRRDSIVHISQASNKMTLFSTK